MLAPVLRACRRWSQTAASGDDDLENRAHALRVELVLAKLRLERRVVLRLEHADDVPLFAHDVVDDARLDTRDLRRLARDRDLDRLPVLPVDQTVPGHIGQHSLRKRRRLVRAAAGRLRGDYNKCE